MLLKDAKYKDLMQKLDKLILTGGADILKNSLSWLAKYCEKDTCITAFDSEGYYLGSTEPNDEYIADIRESLKDIDIKDFQKSDIKYHGRSGYYSTVIPLMYGEQCVGGLLLEHPERKTTRLDKDICGRMAVIVFIYANCYSESKALFMDSESSAYLRGALVEDLLNYEEEDYSCLAYIKVMNLVELSDRKGTNSVDKEISEYVNLLRNIVKGKVYRVSRDCFAFIMPMKEYEVRDFFSKAVVRILSKFESYKLLIVITELITSDIYKSMYICEKGISKRSEEGIFIEREE